MRIVSLNIMQGGGTRVDKILLKLDKYSPDIIVLGEFRINSRGDKIHNYLRDRGFKYFIAGKPEKINHNTVSIFSKVPFDVKSISYDLGVYSHRVVEAVFTNFILLGVYFPNKTKKKPVFEYLLEYCLDNLNDKVAIIGDFNTGKHYIDEEHKTLLFSEYINKMEELGWIDGWRMFHNDKKDYTWYSNKGIGFRIDHIFCSPNFTQVLSKVEYSHQIREEKITDHSALIVEINI